jgi:hypothetical protein
MSLRALSRRLKTIPVQPESTNIRLYRAVSWLICAEDQEKQADLAFLTHWIAFNALYAQVAESDEPVAERERFRTFIRKLARHDEDERIHNILWQRYSGPLRNLIGNQFLYKPFWDHQRGLVRSWETKFRQSIAEAEDHLSRKRVLEFLEIVMDRLYTLRNQLMHGGATYRSSVNRSSVNTGHRVMQLLMPAFVDIMMRHPGEDWGEVHYPVVG